MQYTNSSTQEGNNYHYQYDSPPSLIPFLFLSLKRSLHFGFIRFLQLEAARVKLFSMISVGLL